MRGQTEVNLSLVGLELLEEVAQRSNLQLILMNLTSKVLSVCAKFYNKGQHGKGPF